MTTARELFQAIIDNPKEDAPRLMYADWLDGEKPDPTPADRTQAEFIRVQVGLARNSDPATGGPMTPAREEELRVREKELRDTLIDALGPDIAEVLHVSPGSISFDRGFVHDFDLSFSFSQITSLPEGLTVCGDLFLSNTPITALPEGLIVGGDLDLSHAPITSLPANLQVGGNLYLAATHLSPAAIQSIADMPGLSTKAKCSVLRDLGFDTLAEQVERASKGSHEGRQ